MRKMASGLWCSLKNLMIKLAPCKQVLGPVLFANVFKKEVHHMSCAWHPCQPWKSALQTRVLNFTQA